MNVLIVGSDLLRDALAKQCAAAGHKVVSCASHPFLDRTMPSCDLIIETETESIERKLAVLAALPANVPLLACAWNTSVTRVAGVCTSPGQVVGYSIVPPLRADGSVIELAAGIRTTPSAMEATAAFCTSIHMQPVTVAENPGLVRARVLCCLINEACSALGERVASEADIDRAMQLGVTYPRGLLDWGRQLGYLNVLGVMRGLHEELGEDRYRPAPHLRRLAAA